jgi:hypothetical protein
MTRFNIWYGVVAFLWAQADMRRFRAATQQRIILPVRQASRVSPLLAE